MMGGVNVLLVLLVWIFTAVSEANIDIKIKCEDVTAHVGDEINLTCTVWYPNEKCCPKMYKFMNTTAAGADVLICPKRFENDWCKEKRKNKFSCSYTAHKTKPTEVKFFLQADCGWVTTYFTAKVAGAVKDDTAGGSDRFTGESTKETFGITDFFQHNFTALAVIIPVIICLSIIIMGLIYKKKHNFINTCGFQRDNNMDVHEKILSKCSDRETV